MGRAFTIRVLIIKYTALLSGLCLLVFIYYSLVEKNQGISQSIEELTKHAKHKWLNAANIAKSSQENFAGNTASRQGSKLENISAPIVNKSAPFKEQQYNLRISDPVFEGQAKDSSKYTIKATTVIKTTPTNYNLYSVKAIYEAPCGKFLVNADDGNLDEQEQIFNLHKNVEILFDSATLRASEVYIDLYNRSAISNNPVELLYKDCKITAKAFNTHDVVGVVTLTGGVSSFFNISDF